jgi:hypothetical protein
MGPRAGFETVAKRKISSPGGIKPYFSSCPSLAPVTTMTELHRTVAAINETGNILKLQQKRRKSMSELCITSSVYSHL